MLEVARPPERRSRSSGPGAEASLRWSSVTRTRQPAAGAGPAMAMSPPTATSAPQPPGPCRCGGRTIGRPRFRGGAEVEVHARGSRDGARARGRARPRASPASTRAAQRRAPGPGSLPRRLEQLPVAVVARELERPADGRVDVAVGQPAARSASSSASASSGLDAYAPARAGVQPRRARSPRGSGCRRGRSRRARARPPRARPRARRVGDAQHDARAERLPRRSRRARGRGRAACPSQEPPETTGASGAGSRLCSCAGAELSGAAWADSGWEGACDSWCGCASGVVAFLGRRLAFCRRRAFLRRGTVLRSPVFRSRPAASGPGARELFGRRGGAPARGRGSGAAVLGGRLRRFARERAAPRPPRTRPSARRCPRSASGWRAELVQGRVASMGGVDPHRRSVPAVVAVEGRVPVQPGGRIPGSRERRARARATSAPASDDHASGAAADVPGQGRPVHAHGATVVGAQRRGHLGKVPEHVQGGEGEPREEADLVDRQQRRARARPGEQQRRRRSRTRPAC